MAYGRYMDEDNFREEMFFVRKFNMDAKGETIFEEIIISMKSVSIQKTLWLVLVVALLPCKLFLWKKKTTA